MKIIEISQLDVHFTLFEALVQREEFVSRITVSGALFPFDILSKPNRFRPAVGALVQNRNTKNYEYIPFDQFEV